MLKFLAFVMVPTQFRRFVFGSAEWENCPLIPRFGSNRSDRIFLESHRIFLAREPNRIRYVWHARPTGEPMQRAKTFCERQLEPISAHSQLEVLLVYIESMISQLSISSILAGETRTHLAAMVG